MLENNGLCKIIHILNTRLKNHTLKIEPPNIKSSRKKSKMICEKIKSIDLSIQEKKYVYLMLPCITFMFLGGVAFGYFILVPPATHFLTTFGSDIADPQIRIGNYISIVLRLLLSIGAVFETPVIILFLTRIGVVTPKWLANKRKYAIIFAFILAAIITPTFDPVNQSLVAVPLILLYEMSIWISKLVWRRKPSLAPPNLTPPA